MRVWLAERNGLWWTSCVAGSLKRVTASVSGSYETATRHGETRLKGGRMREKKLILNRTVSISVIIKVWWRDG
jgi:hypothetical protein